MVCENGGIYGFLRPSWVLITYNICPPGMSCATILFKVKRQKTVYLVDYRDTGKRHLMIRV